MAYNIDFFGHCQEDNHDKIWGYATVQDDELYSFWGRRGGNLAFKRHRTNSWMERDTLADKARSKSRYGRRSGYYRPVPSASIEAVWPGFTEAFENQLFLAKMSDQFRVDDCPAEEQA